MARSGRLGDHHGCSVGPTFSHTARRASRAGECEMLGWGWGIREQWSLKVVADNRPSQELGSLG